LDITDTCYIWCSEYRSDNEAVGAVETTASFSFAGVSDINILSSQDREIIVKIQEISVLLSAGKEEQQIMR